MSFVAELKRRNVIRVGILYLVSSWVLLQLTDVLASLLPVPEWTGSLVVLLLALGFVPVLLFAWVYEMTPEGLRREKDIDPSESITAGTGQKINTLIVVLLVIAIAGLIADRLIPEAGPIADTALQADVEAVRPSDDVSIAVLPFSDLSANQDQQYFTDGLSEELLNLLVRVDELRVASRTSSFGYRDSTLGIPAIAEALNVGHVLEGSVRKDGNRIRITAQLIEARTDRHVWSENFDRDFVDIFTIQDEISNAIVAALTGKLGVDDDPVVTVEAVTENLDAYELYLEGKQLYINRERLDESVRLLREAVRLDPDFARAWEGLAAAEILAQSWVIDDTEDRVALAREAANKALEIDPDLSTARAVLGLLAVITDSDYVQSDRYLDEAVEIAPRNTTALLWRGINRHATGFLQLSRSDFERCLQIDPGYLNCKQHLAAVLMSIGDIDLAMQLADETMEQSFHSLSGTFVHEYIRRGQRLLAVQIADAELHHKGAPVIEWIRAFENPGADNSARYARLKDWERQQDDKQALRELPLLYLAFAAYDDLIASRRAANWVAWHPDAASFRQSPQFKQFVRRMNILDYWQTAGYPPQCRPVGSDDFSCS
jgi:TolB-like protein/Tfp pilus assembly protein PilF